MVAHWLSVPELVLGDLNLIQIVDFKTWVRMIRGEIKESILDHIYTADPFQIKNLQIHAPIFCDHKLIMFEAKYINRKVFSDDKK